MKTASARGLAVVTGAAGGLGLAFANQLASQGYRLLLVDRRQQPLEQACESIIARHGTSAESYAIDLARRDDVEVLAGRLKQTPDIELLVNNAGFGSFDYFADADAKFLVAMVDVHVVAPVIFARAVLPGMVERKRGAIINVSSLAAFLQSAGNVQYGATKCFLAFFSLALGEELRGSNVRVQALCPGYIRTDFHEAAGVKGLARWRAPAPHQWMSADDVVSCSLRRLSGRDVIVIPGLGNSILGRLAQMPVLRPLVQWLTRMPRVAPNSAPSAEPCPAPSLGIPKNA